MSDDLVLMTPGPVAIHRDIRDAMAREMISHRSTGFETTYEECQRALQEAFGTDNDIIMVSGSGTAGMETALSNVVGPDDAVVCVTNGYFGERFEAITKRYTTDVRVVATPWGQPVDPAAVAAAVDETVAAVTMVHTDTSVGIVNPVDAVGEAVAASDAVFLVDCITSVGCEPVNVDAWGVDMAVTASQKAIGGPPGLAAVTVSEAAKAACTPGESPFFFDLERHLEKAEVHQTPTTSPVQLFWGLEAGLKRALEEGVRAWIARHAAYAEAIREAGRALGLELFPVPDDRSSCSNAVVVFTLPEVVDAQDIVAGMADRGVLIRGGLGHVSAETIRIGTMGDIGQRDVLRGIDALQETLRDSGVAIDGDGVAHAAALLE